jgi:ribosomal protein RSM22 (predicted rRNA methylase)
VSHVLNELSPQNGVRLQNLARAFSHSLWVESGNHHDSTQLVAMREALRGEFHPIAPCPHRGACKLLEEQNSRHWCHFFSHVPSEVFQDRNWNILADALSVDLRAMPFSYLYLRRTSLGAVEEQASATRMLGAPREYKGYLKALTCRADGLGELTLQKRDDVSLFRRMQKRKSGTYFQWEIDREASRFVRSLDEPDESMVL